MSHPVVAQGEGEAGVDDLTKAAGGFGSPVPERFADFRFVIAEFPGRIGAEGITEGGGYSGALRFWKTEGLRSCL